MGLPRNLVKAEVGSELRSTFSIGFSISRVGVSAFSSFNEILLRPCGNNRGLCCHNREVGDHAEELVPALLEGRSIVTRVGNNSVFGVSDGGLFSFCYSERRFVSMCGALCNRPSRGDVCCVATFTRRCLSVDPFISFAGYVCMTLSFTVGNERATSDSVIVCATRSVNSSSASSSVDRIGR